MKGLLIASSVILGVVVGFLPQLSRPKPNWWKYLIVLLFFINLFLILTPSLVSDNSYANYIASQDIQEKITLEYKPISISSQKDTFYLSNLNYPLLNINNINLEKAKLIDVQYNKELKVFNIVGANKYNLIPISYPLILELKERIKIMVVHVPIAWVSVLAYLLSMIYSILYLRNGKYEHDIIANASANVGVMFTILATITGMIWAKFNWGSYWNWDPRETSIFILLLIYFAYFALRSSIDNPQTKAKLSAVYLIIAFAAVPFLVFIVPRISSGLHPGAAGENTAGPVLGGGAEMLNPNLLMTFGFSMFCFSLLFFWILNLKIRSELIK